MAISQSQENCDFTAKVIAKAVDSGEAPSWLQNNVDWYNAGMINCDTLLNATGWLIQEEIIDEGGFQGVFHELLQDLNLIGLGEASVDISDALNEQIAIREAQRLADQEAARAIAEAQAEFNALVSGQLIDLGEASIDASEAIAGAKQDSFFGDLITGAIGSSSLIVLGIILVVMIARK